MEVGETSTQSKLLQDLMWQEILKIHLLRELQSIPLLLTWKRILEGTSAKLILPASSKMDNSNSKLSTFPNWEQMLLQLLMRPINVIALQKCQEVSTLAMELLVRQLHPFLSNQQEVALLGLWSLSRTPRCTSSMLILNTLDSLQAHSKRKLEMPLNNKLKNDHQSSSIFELPLL